MKQHHLPLANVSRETAARLDVYTQTLRSWNRVINLVSKQDEAHIVDRHIEDSLALAPFISSSTTNAVDIGSGAGFPGLVLAIATGCHFDLIESDQRKCAFLREAARLTNAPVTVHSTRVEHARITPVSLVTARAVAPLPTLLAWSENLLTENGKCVFPKGKSLTVELTEAANQWHMRASEWPNPVLSEAIILVLSEIKRV